MPGTRTIALSPKALELHRAKFGVTYPLEVDIAFDVLHRRAVVRYSFSWQGGTLLAERENDHWVITTCGEWVT